MSASRATRSTICSPRPDHTEKFLQTTGGLRSAFFIPCGSKYPEACFGLVCCRSGFMPRFGQLGQCLWACPEDLYVGRRRSPGPPLFGCSSPGGSVSRTAPQEPQAWQQSAQSGSSKGKASGWPHRLQTIPGSGRNAWLRLVTSKEGRVFSTDAAFRLNPTPSWRRGRGPRHIRCGR